MRPNAERAPGHAFGVRIRATRLATGQTMRSVAQYVGISTAYLADIEYGRKLPMREALIPRLAAILGEDAEALYRLALEARGLV